jgi:hypothetical protein
MSVQRKEDKEISWIIDRKGNYDILREVIINSLCESLFDNKINLLYENFEINNLELECCICIEKREEKYICKFNCNHKFCIDCIYKYISNMKSICPICRSQITDIYIKLFT